MIRAVVLVLAMAGCGRLGFDVGAADGDANQCALRATPSSVTISGTTIIVENFNNDTMPLSAVGVTVVRIADGATLGTTTSDSNGVYSVVLGPGNTGEAVVIQYRHGGYIDVDVYPATALDRDFSFDPNIFSGGALGTVYGAASTTQDGNDGTLIAIVTDCNGAPLVGAAVAIAPAPGHLGYTAGPSDPFPPAATVTALPNTQAVGFNEPPGSAQITTTAPGLSFVAPPATVEVGGVSVVLTHPTP